MLLLLLAGCSPKAPPDCEAVAAPAWGVDEPVTGLKAHFVDGGLLLSSGESAARLGAVSVGRGGAGALVGASAWECPDGAARGNRELTERWSRSEGHIEVEWTLHRVDGASGEVLLELGTDAAVRAAGARRVLLGGIWSLWGLEASDARGRPLIAAFDTREGLRIRLEDGEAQYPLRVQAQVGGPAFSLARGAGLGHSVSGAGDLDGDGFLDLALGVPEAGELHVLLGSASGRFRRERLAGTEMFGWVVRGGGDADGDGRDDLLVGDGSQFWIVRWGAAGLEIAPSAALEGVSAAFLGDLDGDGREDWAIGDSSDAGAVRVWLGGRGLDAAPAVVLEGEKEGSEFGHSLVGPGDLDGDGHADLAVGAPGNDIFGSSLTVFFGRPDGLATEPVRVEGGVNESFTWSLGGGSDIDGDGRPEILVGAPSSPSHDERRGRVIAYSLTEGALVPLQVWEGSAPEQHFGWSVAALPDRDGDGKGDGAAGMLSLPGAVAFLSQAGQSQLASSLAESGFGFDVANAGDLDGDGLGELLVGARGSDGAALIVFGAAP